MWSRPVTRTWICAALSLSIGGCGQERTTESTPLLAVTGATIIDGTGAEPIPNGVVLLEGERIRAVGPASSIDIPDGTEVLPADGQWVIPGMIDLHMHFWESGRPGAQPVYVADVTEYFPWEEEVAWVEQRIEYTLGRYLCSGVTSVVALAAIPWEYEVRDLAAAIDAAPRVLLASGFVGNYPPENDSIFWGDDEPGFWIEDEEAAERLVQHFDSIGVDLVKAGYVPKEQYPLEGFIPALKALIKASHARGLRVSVHANELETARAAVDAGADILAHTVRDRDVDADFIQALLDGGVVNTSSAAVATGHARLLDTELVLSPAEERCLDPEVIEAWEEWAEIPVEARPDLPEWMRRAQAAEDQMVANLEALNEAGVPIAVGSDGGNIGSFHGPAFHRELELLARAGLTPMEILIAATRTGAEALGRSNDLGTLEPGKFGDLVVVSANPLTSVRNFSEVVGVVVRGRQVLTEGFDRE